MITYMLGRDVCICQSIMTVLGMFCSMYFEALVLVASLFMVVKAAG